MHNKPQDATNFYRAINIVLNLAIHCEKSQKIKWSLVCENKLIHALLMTILYGGVVDLSRCSRFMFYIVRFYVKTQKHAIVKLFKGFTGT
jgi:hypothetical protein